ncbi:AraC family transcriptional regulator [Ornithinibacillus salinisoli]
MPLQFGNEKVRYKEHSPTVALLPYIACYWTVTGEELSIGEKKYLKVLPDGCIDFIFQEDRSLGCIGKVTGAMSQFADIPIHRSSAFLGIRFRPGGFHSLFQVAASSHTGHSITLSDIDKSWAEIQYRLNEADDKITLLNTVLLQKLKHRKSVQNDLPITNLLHHIYQQRGNIKVQQLAKDGFMSTRNVQRLFLDWIGLSPKTFCRIVRIQFSLRSLLCNRDDSVAEISASFGYSDQAHFIREFRNHTGMTPTCYLSDLFKTSSHSAIRIGENNNNERGN